MQNQDITNDQLVDYNDNIIQETCDILDSFTAEERLDKALDNAMVFENSYFNTSLNKQSILNEPKEPDETLIGLPRGEVGMLIAPGATGKSFFVLNLLLSSIGLAKNHLVTKPLKVLYLSLEDRLDDIERRLSNYKHALNIDQNKINSTTGDFDIVAYKGAQRLIERYDNSFVGQSALLTEFDSYIKNSKPDLVIIDTLIKTYGEGFDENSNPHMAQVLSHFNELAINNNCSIVLLHHTNKAAMNKDNEQSSSNSRGASSIVDNSRWVMSLQKVEKKYVTCSAVKVNFVAVNDCNYNFGHKGSLIMDSRYVA